MLARKQKKEALKSAQEQLNNLLTNWQEQKVVPILDAKQQIILSPQSIQNILTNVYHNIDKMYKHLIQADPYAFDPTIEQINTCLNGDGLKVKKLEQNFDEHDLDAEISRSFIFKIKNNTIIINVLTNSKLGRGEYHKQGYLGSGVSKTVKEAVQIIIGNNILKTSLLARASIRLCFLKDNNHPKCMQQYGKRLAMVQREVKTSQRYNSPYINEMELGPIFDSTTYLDNNTRHKVSKRQFQDKINQDLQDEGLPQIVESGLPLGINAKKSKSIYVFSKKALGSLDSLRDFLTPQEATAIKDDLSNWRLPEIFYNLFNDALEALKIIHQHGDVHGDFKPDNLLIYRNEHGKLTAKLSDFGLATLREDSSDIKAENIIGTPYYASPQVTKYRKNKCKDKPIKSKSLADVICASSKVQDIYQNDPKHDIWSFGLSLFCMLSNNSDDFTIAENCPRKKELDFLSRRHPILKELLAVDMHKRPTAAYAQQLLRLDYLLTTNNPLEYNEDDLELLKQHKLSLIANGTYCGLFFKPSIKQQLPHDSLHLVNKKITAMDLKKPLSTSFIHKTVSSASLQTT